MIMQPLSENGQESLERALDFELKHINMETYQVDYGAAKPEDLVRYAIDTNTVLSERRPNTLSEGRPNTFASRIGIRLLEFQSQIHSAAEKDQKGLRSDILMGVGFMLASHNYKVSHTIPLPASGY